MEKVQAHMDICKELNEIYSAKNSNYGDSFAKVRREVESAIIVRLMDKIERLKMLYKGEADKVGESIEDSLKDLANYAIMELVERKNDKEMENLQKAFPNVPKEVYKY